MENPFKLSPAAPAVLNPLTAQMARRGQELMSAPWMKTQQMQQEEALQEQRQTAQTIQQPVQQPGQQPLQQPGPTTGVAVDQAEYTNSTNGFGSNVPGSLIGSESGGNWNAENKAEGHGGQKGHFGILQFGKARLQDAKNSGIIPQNMTSQQFMDSEDAQINASNWHFNDIDARIQKEGFNNLIGKNVGGVTLSMNGMRAMAHLGGFNGLRKFINTGGRYNPNDSYMMPNGKMSKGTSLLDYGKQHQN
jgi:hypothetical protein